jgi:hypothetical protein
MLWIMIRSARYFQRMGRTWHSFLSHYKTIPDRRDTIRKHCMTETKYITKTLILSLLIRSVSSYDPYPLDLDIIASCRKCGTFPVVESARTDTRPFMVLFEAGLGRIPYRLWIYTGSAQCRSLLRVSIDQTDVCIANLFARTWND